MKLLLPILLFLSLYTLGQKKHDLGPYDIRTAFDRFNGEDSLDKLSINMRLLNIISDTIPVFSKKEDEWKELKTTHFFYDSSNALKRVLYTDRSKGAYYFYFDGANLRKARYHKFGHSADTTYYFSIKDNEYPISQNERKTKTNPNRKTFFELLDMSKHFYKKFRMLLQTEYLSFK